MSGSDYTEEELEALRTQLKIGNELAKMAVALRGIKRDPRCEGLK